jgi:hypothetical protein
MKLILVLRGLVGLGFASWLGRSQALSWEGYFGIVGRYLTVDGLLAAVIAAALLREGLAGQKPRETALGIVILVDAGGRLLSGLALHLWPGIAGFPVTAVMFVAIMATCTAAVGLVEGWLSAREEVAIHGPQHKPPQFMAGPVGLASLVSVGFGLAVIAAIGSPDLLRRLIDGFVAAAGVFSMAMAWSWMRLHQARALRAASA